MGGSDRLRLELPIMLSPTECKLYKWFKRNYNISWNPQYAFTNPYTNLPTYVFLLSIGKLTNLFKIIAPLQK
jgi:hypothetical protein